MKWWLIPVLILLLLFLIGLIRLGARIRYDTGGLQITVLAGPVRIQVFPAKPAKARAEKKPKKKKQARKEKTKKPAEQKADKPGTVERVMALLPVVAQAAGALRRKILIHHLTLKAVWAAPDAAAAAIGYGRAHALIGIIWPVFAQNFRVKQHEFQVDVNYEARQPEIAIDVAVTMTVGQLLSFALHYGIKLLISWCRSGRSCQQRHEEA